MPEIKLRYNEDAEEVELLVNGEVALSSGNDVFVSWVEAYNEKHPVEVPEPEVEEPENSEPEPEEPEDSEEPEEKDETST